MKKLLVALLSIVALALAGLTPALAEGVILPDPTPVSTEPPVSYPLPPDQCTHSRAADQIDFRYTNLEERIYRKNQKGCEYTEIRSREVTCPDCGYKGKFTVSKDFQSPSHSSVIDSVCTTCMTFITDCPHPFDQRIVDGDSKTFIPIDDQYHRQMNQIIRNGRVICESCNQDITKEIGELTESLGPLTPHTYLQGACVDCGHKRGAQTDACTHQRIISQTQQKIGEFIDENYCKKYYYAGEARIYTGSRSDITDYCRDCGIPMVDGKPVITDYQVTYHYDLQQLYGTPAGDRHEFENGVCLWCDYRKSDGICTHTNTNSVTQEIWTGQIPDPLICGYYRTFQTTTYCLDCATIIDKNTEVTDEYVLASPYHNATYERKHLCQYCAVPTPKCTHPMEQYDLKDGKVLEDECRNFYDPHMHHHVTRVRYENVRCGKCGFWAISYWIDGNSKTEPHEYVDGVCVLCDYKHDKKLPDCAHKNLLKPGDSGLYIFAKNFVGCWRYMVRNDGWTMVDGQQVPCDYCLDCGYGVYQGQIVLNGCAVLTALEDDSSNYKSHNIVDHFCTYCGYKEETIDPTAAQIIAPASDTIAVGEPLALSVRLEPAEAYADITWSSSKTSRATVDENGVVKPLREGSVTITAKAHNGEKDTIKLTIIDPYKPEKLHIDQTGTVTLSLYDTLQLTTTLEPATARSEIEWKSSSKSRATVDANGVVTPIKEGTVTITAETHNGKKDTVKVKIVDPFKPEKIVLDQSGTIELPINQTLALSFTLEPATARSEIEWKSSSKSRATVDENGVITPIKEGTVTITAETHNGKKDTVKVKIIDPIEATDLLVPESMTITVGSTFRAEYQLVPANATSRIAISTDEDDLLRLNADGSLTALTEGSATLEIRTSSGEKAKIKVLIEKTPDPAAEPSPEPTAEPDAEPSLEPTAEPVAESSPEPTTEPDAEPSLEPTTEPAAEPAAVSSNESDTDDTVADAQQAGL